MNRNRIILMIALIFTAVLGTQAVQAQNSQSPIAANLYFTTEMNRNLTVEAANGLIVNVSSTQATTLQLIKVSDVSNGTVLLVHDGSFYYIPGANFVGTDQFQYQVSDGTVSSNVATVTITVTEPIASPDVNALLTNTGATFSWTPPFNDSPLRANTDYRLTIWDTNGNVIYDATINVNDVCSAQSCGLNIDASALPVDINSGAYRWRITAIQNGTPDWSSEANFDMTPPGLPIANVQISEATARVIWGNDPLATWYQIYVGAKAGDFSQMQWHETHTVCDAQTCTLTFNNLSGGDYEVYVQAYGPGGLNTGGLDGWSGPFNFNVNVAPPALPQNLNVINPNGTTLAWQHSAYATYYQVWVGTETPFSTAFIGWFSTSDLNCTSGTCTFNTILPSGTYQWYVQAYGPGGITQDGIEGWVGGPTFSVQ